MPRQIKLPSLSNVQAGSTATLKCPLGPTYDSIKFAVSGSGATPLTISLMKNIQVLINGKVIQTFRNGQELSDINDHYKRPVSAGYLTLHFLRPELESIEQSRLFSLGTEDLKGLEIRFDVDATVTGSVVEAYAQQSAPQPLGLITKIKSLTAPITAAGEFEIDNISTGPRIMAMHLFKEEDDITDVKVDLNSVNVFESTDAINNQFLSDANRKSIAKYFHINMLQHNDFSSEALITENANDYRVKPTVTAVGASAQVRAIVEYADGWAGL